MFLFKSFVILPFFCKRGALWQKPKCTTGFSVLRTLYVHSRKDMNKRAKSQIILGLFADPGLISDA